MDSSNELTLTFTPTVTSDAVLSANATLFTSVAGINQDLGICIATGTTSSCANGPVVWKEAGGYSAYKPATVYAQAEMTMNAGTTYTVDLYWKANTSGTDTIFSGAGSAPNYSPTAISAVLTPHANSYVYSMASTGQQFSTSSTSWNVMNNGTTYVQSSFTPAATGVALFTANADVFTGTAGTNQDIGICVAQGASIPTGCSGTNTYLVAWSENAGASVYKPIAALVEGTLTVYSGTQYTMALIWRAGTSNSIYAGAGTSPFSVSSIIAQEDPSTDNYSTAWGYSGQFSRAESGTDNGTSWADMSSGVSQISYTPSANGIVYLGGNATLFANAGGFNIDLGICAQTTGSCTNQGWTETGSVGAWEPDSNYVQVAYSVAANTAYTFKLQWRTSSAMSSGNAILAGAGSSSNFSSEWLSALFVPYSVPAAPTSVVAHAVADTDSTGSATVSWTAPSSPGSPITQYTITPYVGTTAQTSLAQTDTDTNSQGVVTTAYGVPGLTKGTAYTFQVTATNAAGQGPAGISNLVTPSAPPAYSIAGSGGTTSSPIITAPARGFDNGKAAKDGTIPQQVALGNLSGGGSSWPDIVTANGSGANAGDSLSALKNLKSTSGAFAQPANTTAPGESASKVALGNLFGHADDVQDAVVVNGGSTIYVLKNNDDGTGTFTQTATYTLPAGNAEYVVLANVHSSSGSTLDIVTVGTYVNGWCYGNASSIVSVLLNNGSGSFSTATQYQIKDCSLGSWAAPNGLATGDLNGDGLADIAFTSWVCNGCGSADASLDVLLNQGNGSFGTITSVASFKNGHPSNANSQVAIGPFTGNGVNDIAVVTDDNYSPGTMRGITLYLGKGDGTFPASSYYPDPALDDSTGHDYGEGEGIAVADMNGDGTPDVVTADNNSIGGVGGFSVYLNTGTKSGLDVPVFLPTPAFTPQGIALGDVNGDGKADVIVENNGTTSPSAPSNVEVLINGTDFPPLGSALGPNEMHGCLMCQALAAGGSVAVDGNWPVAVNSGEMSHTFTDISIPARGYPIQVTQTYNSLNAGSGATDYGLGYGWWSPLLMSLTQSSSTGITTVTEEDGAQAQFWTANLTAVAPRTQATLVHNGDGTWTFTRYSGDTFTFNSSGQITKIQDLTGDYLSFGYSGTPSVVTSLTHADGRSLAIAWSGGDIASITDSNVSGETRTVSFTYGTSTHAHELLQIDWKVNSTNDRNEQFTYDETTWVHGLASMQDPDGHVVSQTYNSDGTTATQTIDPSGLNRQTTYSYWPARTSTYSSISAALITDPLGNQEIDEFAYGEMIQRTIGFTGCSTTLSGTWPSGTGCNSGNIATTTHSFDPQSLGTALTVDPNGNTSTASYDARGNVLSTTDGMGRATSYTYTSTDATYYHPSTMTDGNGVTTTYTYDSTYRMLTRVCTPLPSGACGSTPTMPAKVITYTYGNVSHPGDLMSMTNGDSKTTSYGYDTYGNLGETEDPAGDVSATEFNKDGWMLASWTPKGGCTFSSSLTNGQAPANCSSTYQTAYNYADLSGNDVFWADVLSVNAPLSRTSSAIYDNDNNVIQATDFNGNSTTYAYNNAGERCWTLPGGTSTNGCGSPPTNARVTDYNGDGQVADQKNGIPNTLQSYAYDTRGNLTTLTVDPGSSPHLNQATAFTYDLNGNALSKTDPGGSCTGTISGCTTYGYNADNQVCWYLMGASSNACGSVPSGAVSFTYDSDGQRTAMADSTGSWSYTLDTLHRLTSVTEAQGGGNTATIGYQYNYRNEPTQITYPGTTGSVTVGYDNAGRENSVQDWNSHTTTFNYDANSNLTTTVFPGGTCTAPVSLCDTNTYNAADQLTGISDMQNSSTTIFAATYTRDSNGQPTSDTSATSNQNNYGYTALNQPCYAGSNHTSACTSPPSGSQPFVYDNGDNITTFGGTTQTYNTADQLCWTVSGTSSNGCGSPPSGSTSYGFDARDNRTSMVPSSGSATCYTYSETNWLTQIQTGSGSGCSSPTTVATYLNNGDGLRMSKTVGGTTTRAAWDLSGGLPLQLVDGSTDYVYGPGGMVLEQISTGGTLWYHHDQAGSVRAMSDGSGYVKATYTFDPYGNVTACTGATVTVNGSNVCTGTISVSNPFDFNGQYRDDESGLYYLRARAYDPATGAFLQRDLMAATTRQPYAYASDNPLANSDPSGNIPIACAALEVPVAGEAACAGNIFLELLGVFGLGATAGANAAASTASGATYDYGGPGTATDVPSSCTGNGVGCEWPQPTPADAPDAAGVGACIYAGTNILFAHTKNARGSTWDKHSKGTARQQSDQQRSSNLPSNQPPADTPPEVDPYTDPNNPWFEHYPGQYRQ